MKRYLKFIPALVVFLLLARIFIFRPVSTVDATMVMMGTTARISIVLRDVPPQKAKWAMEQAFQLLKADNDRFDRYDPESELNRLNRQAGIAAFSASSQMFAILNQAKRFGTITKGAFDVTVGSLQKNGGYDSIILLSPGNRIKFSQALKVDLGGIATGFSLDQVAGVFRQSGIRDYLVDVGGDIICGGSGPSGRDWTIGVQSPFSNGLAGELSLSDKAVSTSGNYIKQHILNPETAAPVASGLVSVTVVAPKAITADALSTAFFVMGEEKIRSFLNENPGIGAILIRQNNGKSEVVKINLSD